MLRINSNICFYVTLVSSVCLHVWVRTRWFRSTALSDDYKRWSVQLIIYTRQSLLYSSEHIKDSEEGKDTCLLRGNSSLMYLKLDNMSTCICVYEYVCVRMYVCMLIFEEAAIRLKKTSLTVAPDLSIVEPLNRQSHHFCRKEGGRREGGGGSLLSPVRWARGRGWEGERHGRVSQWETEMIKRLLLLTERRGLVSIAPSSFHSLV